MQSVRKYNYVSVLVCSDIHVCGVTTWAPTVVLKVKKYNCVSAQHNATIGENNFPIIVPASCGVP